MILNENAKAQADYFMEETDMFSEVYDHIMQFEDIADIRKHLKDKGDVHIEELKDKDNKQDDGSVGIFVATNEDFVISVNGNTITGFGNLYELGYGMVYSKKLNMVLGMGHSEAILWEADTLKEVLNTCETSDDE